MKQIDIVMREHEKMKNPEVLESVQTSLLLVVIDIPKKVLSTKSPRELAEAELWALKLHLRASDNIVRVPPVPEWLKKWEET